MFPLQIKTKRFKPEPADMNMFPGDTQVLLTLSPAFPHLMGVKNNSHLLSATAMGDLTDV